MSLSGITIPSKTSIKATLQKVSNNENAISFELYTGYFIEAPLADQRFRFYLDAGSYGRMDGWEWITTSMVKSITRKDNVITLVTLNSVYEVTLTDK